MPSGIKIEGLNELIKTIREKSIGIQNEVNAELTAGAVEIRDLAKKLAPVYESRLIGAIVADTNTKFHKEVTCNVYYAGYIEFGTGRKVKIPAGLESVAAEFRNQPKRGGFDEMVDALTDWVRKKGLAGTYSTKTQRRTGNPLSKAIQDRQLARHIAIRILQNGINPHPFFFRAYDAKKLSILQNIKRVIGQ